MADIDFWDAAVGYAVGGGGYAARSRRRRSQLADPADAFVDDQLVDIALVGPDELWVATAGGIAALFGHRRRQLGGLDAGPAGFGAFSAIAANPAGDAWIAGWQGAIRHFAGPPPPPVNQPPAAAFSFSTTGLSVVFTDSSSDNDGTIASWLWNFDDGSTSTERHPTHLFAAAGTYIVSLTVTDDDGAIDVGGHAIVVQPGPGGTFGDFTEVTPLDRSS